MLISCGKSRSAHRHGVGRFDDGCRADPMDGESLRLEQGREKIPRTTQPDTTATKRVQISNNAEEWEYVAEGGANVVFRPGRRAENSPTISGLDCVLRVPKSSQPFGASDLLEFIRESVLPVMNHAPNTGNIYGGIDDEAKNKYRLYGTLVLPGSTAFLDDLNERLQSPMMEARRPEHRRGSQLHCPAAGLAAADEDSPLMLLPDVVGAGDVCIELKPKSSLGLDSNNHHHGIDRYCGRTMKQRTCRYCMHQAWKVHCGKLRGPRRRGHEYCPMDLFSGETLRMAKAVRALMDDPQNNLRLFRPDGTELTGTIRSTTTTNTIPGGMNAEELVAVVVHALRESRVLDDLRRAHELDELDIEGMWSLHETIESARNEDETATPMDAAKDSGSNAAKHPQCHEPQSQPKPQFAPRIHRFFEAMGCDNTTTWKEIRSRYQKLLEEYLLATTMKDCSLLLSIRKASNEQIRNPIQGSWEEMEYRIECDGGVYFVLISIVDLDRKPASRLSKYHRLDHDIVHHYSESHGLHEKDCFGLAVRTSQLSSDEAMVPVRGNMMCRLLFPNPVCLLTVYDRIGHTSNVMTLTWLTPIDNGGTFVCSIHKRRHTAGLLNVSSTFVLNVPTLDMEDTVLGIGSCSGRDTDKFRKFGLEVCRPGGFAAGEVTATDICNKKKSKKHQSEQERIKHAIALRDCIAHTVCTVKEKQDHGQHWLMVCTQQLAWCRKPYFEDGKRFRRSSESLAPYMTFLGSKTFGSVV